MTRIQAIKDAVYRAYNDEARTVRRSGVRSIHSRGRWMATMGREGQCDPMPGAECYTWNGSLKAILKAVEAIEADYPECDELWIEGGFDGAECPRYYHEGDYEPWVGSWDVCLWQRHKGWLFTEDGQQLPYDVIKP